jgi:DNA replication protein DnaC
MTTTNTVDAARVELLLNELRLPGIRLMWAKLAGQSDKEGWPAARFLAALAEHETADRGRRRIERHLAEARLPAGKTLATFDFESVPMVSKAQVMVLASGDAWLEKGANILLRAGWTTKQVNAAPQPLCATARRSSSDPIGRGRSPQQLEVHP